MKHAHKREAGSYYSHGEFMVCELCGRKRTCNENDGIVACQSCQSDLLPAGWAL